MKRMSMHKGMKSGSWKLVIISIILGIIFGSFSYLSAVDRLERHAISVEADNDELVLDDILVTSFLHRDFDQFDYLWRKDSTVLMSPIIFYLVGSLVGTHPFLKKNKSYHYFIYTRCYDNRRLSYFLLSKICFPIFSYSLFYFVSLCVGMILFKSDFIEPVLKISVVDLISFFIIRLLVLLFLVLVMFMIFIKKETAVAVVVSILTITFIFLITIHVQVVNLALLDDFKYMVKSILLWGIINFLMYLTIKFGIRYELS